MGERREGGFEGSYGAYVASLPPYLAAFAEPQNYGDYTPENQAVWRFVMRQLVHILKVKAPKVYEEGLKKASIPVERIPRIEEMIGTLADLGWGAICVNGFIPPAAFMEYNAHKVLPVSAQMRTLNHLLYTPAPDIVHEAAGHAPIIADPLYGSFLQKVGEVGAKALSNRWDRRVYEAIRKLSIIKEHPHSTDEEAAQAQRELDEASEERAKHPVSEAAMISRFHWWSVEYGLLKKTDGGWLVYGAGLLSSLGESLNCLEDTVEKIKLSPACVETDYDITTEQPQLFYVDSFDDLFRVLDELACAMAFRLGGRASLEKAIACGCPATAVFDSGIQVSGVWTKCLTDNEGRILYVGTQGPTSLSYADKELEGHGESTHPHGFSCPLGRLENSASLSGFVCGERARLSFQGGVVVEGLLASTTVRNGCLLIMSFSDCSVRGPLGEVLFEPEWGMYDMAVGEEITSVFGGPADKKNYDFITKKSPTDTPPITYTPEEKEIFDLYRTLRHLREEGPLDPAELARLYETIRAKAPDNWLLLIEVLELAASSPLEKKVCADLAVLGQKDAQTKHLIDLGLGLV